MSQNVPIPEIEQQLAHMLRSQKFVRAEARARLLTYLVEHASKDKVPTEWEIATEVFGRGPDWVDSDRFVGLYLKRLRDDLNEYYAREGSADPVRIWIIGRTVKAEFRGNLIIAPQASEAFDIAFLAARDAFFTSPDEAGPRCVVTGESTGVGWHHLDGDPYNFSLGNLIPLCRRLRSHIDALKQRKKRTGPPDLDPKHLADKLAPRYFREWRVAAAYGSAALAFYMGEPPYSEEPSNLRVLRVCDIIHYARHHFFEPLMHHVIQHIVVPFLFRRIDAIDPVAAIRLAIQLTALLEEAGYYEDAEQSLAFASYISRKADPSSFGSLNSFTLLRRRAQLLAERSPEDSRFHNLLDKAQEHTGGAANRILTLNVVRVHRLLRQGSPKALERAHEVLAPLIGSYNRKLFRNDRLIIPAGLGAADFSEIFLLSGIAACRLRPDGWKHYAEETVTAAKTLMRLGGHVLPAEYAKFLADATDRNNSKATRMLRLSAAQVRHPLRDEARVNVDAILRCLARMRLVTSGAANRQSYPASDLQV